MVSALKERMKLDSMKVDFRLAGVIAHYLLYVAHSRCSRLGCRESPVSLPLGSSVRLPGWHIRTFEFWFQKYDTLSHCTHRLPGDASELRLFTESSLHEEAEAVQLSPKQLQEA